MIYNLPELTFSVVRPQMPLKQWYDKQAKKPYLLCNASLYVGNRPIGTIIENGNITQNAGNGFGFGVLSNGTAGFGTPWKGWKEYLTGYYGIVQNGVVVPKPWSDTYVFDTPHLRIAIGETKSGFCIATQDNMTILNFAEYCANQGLISCSNLDGGGSRFLILNGKLIYNSSRTPYNAIVGYLKQENKNEKINQDNEVKKVIAIATKKQSVYTASGTEEPGRYIAKNDRCEIGQITRNLLIPVSYPTSAGMRASYIKSLEGFTQG